MAEGATDAGRGADAGVPAGPLPPAEFGEDQVAWAMWLYFAEGLTQNEVARAIGVSRASVANYIAEGRRRGLVEVKIAPDLLARIGLGRRLAARFGLLGAHVIPDMAGADETELRRRLGIAAAQLLLPRLAGVRVLGVAWGRTMLALAEALPARSLPALRVVQVAGSSLGEDRYSPEFCTALIAQRLGARCENLHAPAILSSPAMRDALLAEPGIARQLARLRDCDVVVLGIGELDRGVSFADPQLLPGETVARYIAAGGETVFLGRFLDAHGREIAGPLSGRQIGMELADLARVPCRIAVAGGPRKVAAIRAVLAGGHATEVVTDAASAAALLEHPGPEDAG